MERQRDGLTGGGGGYLLEDGWQLIVVEEVDHRMLKNKNKYQINVMHIIIPQPNQNGTKKQCVCPFVFPSVTPHSAVVQLSKKHNTKINNACTLPNINFITFKCVSTSHNPQMFKIFFQILACRRLSCDAIYITNGRQQASVCFTPRGCRLVYIYTQRDEQAFVVYKDLSPDAQKLLNDHWF